jgi:hypothetical protein
MDEDAVRIVAIEDIDDTPNRVGPPAWFVFVIGLSLISGVWILNQRERVEPAPVESRTVYTVPGWEPTFESVGQFLEQPRSALGFTWSLIAMLDSEFGTIEAGSGIGMVMGSGSGLVAVGGSGGSAAVWTSVDGATWSRAVDVDNASPPGYHRWMSGVAVGGPGFVAVGVQAPARRNVSGELVYGDAAVWTSVDGLVWDRVPHDEEVFGSATLRQVAAGGRGLVAVGEDLQHGTVGVWVSDNGLAWRRAPVDKSVFAEAGVEKVVAGGPGFVAVGHTESQYSRDEEPDQEPDAVVWFSPDGMSWSRVPHVDSVFGGQGPEFINDVIVGGPGLVAVGGSDQSAAVWTSVDGVAWMRVPHDESIFGFSTEHPWAGGEMAGLAVVDQQLVAVSGWDGSLWTSNDGVTWARSLQEETDSGLDGGLPGHRLIAEGLDYFLINGNEVWKAVPAGQ